MAFLTADYSSVFLKAFSRGSGGTPWAAPSTSTVPTGATIILGVSVTMPTLKSGTNATFKQAVQKDGANLYFFQFLVTGNTNTNTFCLPEDKINTVRLQWG